MGIAGWIILGGVFLGLAVLGGVGYKLASHVARPHVHTLEESRSYEEPYNFVRNYDELPKERYEIPVTDGLKLYAEMIPAEKPSKSFVIISHGFTSNRYGSLKYMFMYRSFGYNCILYENRGHGVNPRTICTMGLKESKDLMEVIRDTYDRYGRDIYLGLQGESMGSGLSTLALQYHPDIHFLVDDCGYAVLSDVFKHEIRNRYHLPEWILYPANLVSRILYGYSAAQVNPIEALKDNHVPICFMHGQADQLISDDHSRRMQQATAGYSELHLFPGAGHAMDMATDEKRYCQIVAAFLQKVQELENR